MNTVNVNAVTDENFKKRMNKTIQELKTYNKVLFLTTSNRWRGEENAEKPKSTLAYEIARKIGYSKVTILEVPQLKIYSCEGNI